MDARGEARRLAGMLASLVKLSPYAIYQVEEKLGYSRGNLNRIFAGKIELKLTHVLEVLGVLDVPPSRFFAMVFAEPAAAGEAPGDLVASLKTFEAVRPPLPRVPPLSPPPPLPPNAETETDLEARVERAVERYLRRRAVDT